MESSPFFVGAVMLRLSLLLTAASMVGCASSQNTASAPSSDVNFLGIVKVENDSYEPTSAVAPTLSEGELGVQENPTGRKVELLWGLLTYTDY